MIFGDRSVVLAGEDDEMTRQALVSRIERALIPDLLTRVSVGKMEWFY